MAEGAVRLFENWPAASKGQVNENVPQRVSGIMRSYLRRAPSEVPQTVELPAEYNEVAAD
jgi:hypothetical protein